MRADSATECARAKHREPSRTWTYRDAAGAVLFHVARFDSADGKAIMPLSLWREPGGLRWHWRGIPEPRPLYGLDRLTARADARVIVCEGEKDADAAGELLPDLVAITSPNGSRSAAKADWTPLRGRRVIVWPDADEPGAAYARDVVRLARKAGAASVAVLRLDTLATLHGDALPAGWGAADALTERMDAGALARIIADPANVERTSTLAVPTSKAASQFLALADGELQGRRAGVYYVPTMRDKRTGEYVEGAPEWVCSPLAVEALTRDTAGAEWGRLLQFPDRHRRARGDGIRADARRWHAPVLWRDARMLACTVRTRRQPMPLAPGPWGHIWGHVENARSHKPHGA